MFSLNERRCTDKKNKDVADKKVLKEIIEEFRDHHLNLLCNSHLQIVLTSHDQFVGTRALALSIKFLAQSLHTKQVRLAVKPHIEQLLFGVSLPLFVQSKKDKLTFENDQVEYVRLQVDHHNEFNVKRQLSKFIEKLCGLVTGTRKQKGAAVHFIEYMTCICNNFETSQTNETAVEALLYAFGNLKERCICIQLPEIKARMQHIMQNYAYVSLAPQTGPESTERTMLRARACWVYGKYGSFDFPDDHTHQQAATDRIIQHLYHEHIAVRVEAALALSEMLDHQIVQDLCRPGLGSILKVFLKIMDDIDFEELVGALRKIVETFEDEIAPFAVSLCQKLSQAYVRCIVQKGENIEDIDTEISSTADGLFCAIRRVLNSISGKFPELYPQLEAILEEAIGVALSDSGQDNADEALTCIAELLYNQQEVSPRMWSVFFHIVNLYINDLGTLDGLLSAASVPLINFMVKAPEIFKN